MVGVGGDVVSYQDKKLTVNGQPLPQVRDGTYGYLENLRYETAREVPGDGAQRRGHARLRDRRRARRRRRSTRRTCGRSRGATIATTMNVGSRARCLPGHYFMMGDNRDNSDDSRYWGFVPDDHIRGKAFFIWFNWDDISSLAFKRVGSGIR